MAVVHHPVGPESDEEAAAEDEEEEEEEGVRGDSTQHGVQFWRCHEQPSSKYGHFLVNYEILVRAGDVSHISCRS